MDKFEEYILTNVSTVTDKTKKNYIDTFRFITKGCDDTNFLDIFNNLDEIKTRVNKSISVNSRAQHLSSIKKLCQHYKLKKLMSQETEIEFLKFCKTTNAEKITQIDKQENPILYSYTDFLKLLDLYEKDSIEYLFLAINLLIPPRRRDWEHAIFVEHLPNTIDKNINYVVVGDEGPVSLAFYKFKTEKDIGHWNKLIENEEFIYLKYFPTFNPNELSQLLKNSFYNNPRNEVFDYKKILITINKNKYNINFTQNGLRHAFSNFVFQNRSISQFYLKKIYTDMGGKNLECFRNYDTIIEVKNFIDDNSILTIDTQSISDSVSITETESDIENNLITTKNMETQTENNTFNNSDIITNINKKIEDLNKQIAKLILTKKNLIEFNLV